MPSVPALPAILSYQYSSADASQCFDVTNPANGAVLTTIQAGDAATTERAIAAAQAALPRWSAQSPAERGAILLRCAAKLEQHSEELAALLCAENGKPYHDALAYDIRFLPAVFRYFGSLVDKLPNEFYDRGDFYVSVVREPHGVCAGILPFNWPPIHCGGKTAPALAAGNVMILKPGEQAPLTVLRIVDLLNTVLPFGVLQVVPGLGPEVPQTLVSHPSVKMISFTGSTAAGKAVSQTAAPGMKPLALELGGKNAMLIFDDADLDRALRCALDGGFFNKGEACTASSRLLIQAGVYDTFVARLADAVRRLRVGDGMREDTHVGPVVSKVQQQKVQDWIVRAARDGARIAAQADLPTDHALRDGYFVAPTLLADVTRDMAVAQEEVFGPVVTATRFTTEDEAVEIANESRYGLVGSVFTKDSEKAWRVSRRLETGMVFVNNYTRNVLGLPFGGVKDSGHGREHAISTLAEWSTAKFVQVPSGRAQTLPVWKAAEEVLRDSS